jgi:hypothetical protein
MASGRLEQFNIAEIAALAEIGSLLRASAGD